MTLTTVISRPGGVADVDETDVNVAPIDWPAGDNDNGTVCEPTFDEFSGHAKYGLAWLQDPGDPDIPTTGSDLVPEGATVVSQRLVVWWLHGGGSTVEFVASEGDGGSISGTDSFGGDFPLVTSTYEVEGWVLHSWCRLFATATFVGEDPAPADYSVPIAEWWIETDYESGATPAYIEPGLAADLLEVGTWYR